MGKYHGRLRDMLTEECGKMSLEVRAKYNVIGWIWDNTLGRAVTKIL